MNTFRTQHFEVRPVMGNTPVGYGLAKWETQRLDDGSSRFWQYLTDALMYVENVRVWDALSDDARNFWDMVANS